MSTIICRCEDLTEEEIVRITNTIQKNAYKIEGDLRRDFSQNIKRLSEISILQNPTMKG